MMSFPMTSAVIHIKALESLSSFTYIQSLIRSTDNYLSLNTDKAVFLEWRQDSKSKKIPCFPRTHIWSYWTEIKINSIMKTMQFISE